MEKKVILMTTNATKWIFIVSGLINLAIGTRLVFKEEIISNLNGFLGMVLIGGAVGMLIYALIVLRPQNKLLPKILLDENGILVKEDIRKSQREINWVSIKQITFRPFELDFLLHDDRTETIELHANGEISIEIKKNIRKFAEHRSIQIIGG